jgi:hypothetical protein
LGVAVVAGCLSGPALAQPNQQPSMPTPYGAARTPPEPLPIGACPTPSPNLVPGPLTPDKAPPGPPDCLSLPANTTSAFQCENFPPEFACFFDVGAQALQRQRLGLRVLALTDVDNLHSTVKLGVVPLPNSPVALNANDIVPDLAWGPRLTFGVLAGADIIEATGYFIPRTSRTVQAVNPGRLDPYFFNAPPGFEGFGGLFTQDDLVRTTLESQVGNAELNYRYTDLGLNGLELILGVRYFDVLERLSTFVDQNVISAPLNSMTMTSNPITQANYSVQTHNRFVAPQFGFEGDWGVCSWLSVGVLAKGAWGMNFATQDHNLSRGDGLVGFATSHTDNFFSQMYEVGAFFEIHVTERCNMRAGYNGIWFLHMDAVIDQYQVDLAKQQTLNHSGSVFYGGPMIELQFLF